MPIGRVSPPGDLAVKQHGLTTGPDYIVQKIKSVLRLIRGEWFLDTTAGCRWFEDVLVKSPSLELVRGLVRDKILSVEGVVKVNDITLRLDKKTRTLQVYFFATLDDGSRVGGSVGIG